MKRKYMKPSLRVISTMMQVLQTGSIQGFGASVQANPGFSNIPKASRSATWLDDDDDWYEED